MLRQKRPTTAHPFIWGPAFVSSDALHCTKVVYLASFVLGGKYQLFRAMISHPRGTHTVPEVRVQTFQPLLGLNTLVFTDTGPRSLWLVFVDGTF